MRGYGVAKAFSVLAHRARSEGREGSGQTILLARREKDGERHPRWSLAPGARALRRASLDGRNGTSMDAIPQEREIGSYEEAS
jgi:hypothetical protein